MGKVNARGVVVWRQSDPDLRDSAGDCGKGPALRDSAGGVHDVIGWYEKAARQGETRAMHNLGLLYQDGQGVRQSYPRAAEWYEKAARQGCADAQV